MLNTLLVIIKSININFILIPLMIMLFVTVMFYCDRFKRMNKFFNFKKTKKEKVNIKKITSNTKKRINAVLSLKNNQKFSGLVLNLYLIMLFIIFLTCLMNGSIILSLLVPVIIHFFINKILDQIIVKFDIVVRKNFATLVNHMVKLLSKTNDLGVVLYESSKELEEPLRTLILKLSREIIIDNDEKQLIKFMEETNNLWLHSFILTLLSYRENSSKENFINNLLKLSNLVEDRNILIEKVINDRKPIVIMNYMVLAVGVAVFIANLIFNPMMKLFMLSPTGIICSLVGLVCFLGTVLINISLVKY